MVLVSVIRISVRGSVRVGSAWPPSLSLSLSLFSPTPLPRNVTGDSREKPSMHLARNTLMLVLCEGVET